jgi:hypothetical protein
MNKWIMSMVCTGFPAPILLLVALASVSAPSAPTRYLLVTTIEVRADQRTAFESYQKQIAEARRKTGETRTVRIYQTRLGGPPTRYRVVIPFQDHQEMESWPSLPELLTLAYGEREGARIMAAGNASIASAEAAVRVLRPEFSSGTGRAGGGRFSQVVVTDIEPALAEDYAAFLRTVKTAEDIRGIRTVRRTNSMGPAFVHYAVRQFDEYSDVGTWPAPPALLREKLGHEASAQILARANAAVRSRSMELIEVREDLSYAPR